MQHALLISTYDLGHQPFGLASPAAWLQKHGFTVHCGDTSLDPLPVETIEQADLIAFYLPMHTATRLAVRTISQVVKINPKAHLCCYGLYAPLNKDYLRSLGVGTILGGEFEAGLLHLAQRLKNREGPLRASRQREPVISLARQQFLLPERGNLPELSRYSQLVRSGQSTGTVGYVEASRGCKHSCRHCPIVPIYKGKFRIVQADIAQADVRQQVEAGAEHITFGDPDFFNGTGHTLPLVKAIHDEFPRLSYDVTIKIEHILRHAHLLPLLQETGCVMVTSAVESIDDRVLSIFRKNHTHANFIQAVQLLDETSLALNPTFIPFTPWTTVEGYRELLSAIHELDLVARVAPVQWTIRLLIPAGSLLLEIPEIRGITGKFNNSSLTYEWRHPDERVDALHEEITRIVTVETAKQTSSQKIFTMIWEKTNQYSPQNLPPPQLPMISSRATFPYLNEPWYC